MTARYGYARVVTIDELYADYERWCGLSALRALPIDAFADAFDRLRELPQLAGKIRKFGRRHYGVRLVSNVAKLPARKRGT